MKKDRPPRITVSVEEYEDWGIKKSREWVVVKRDPTTDMLTLEKRGSSNEPEGDK